MINDNDLVKPLKYELFIETFVIDKHNKIVYGKFHKIIDERTDFENIINDPLNNFLGYSIKEIIYMHIVYYPIYILGHYEIKDINKSDTIIATSKYYEQHKDEIDEFIEKHEKQAYNEIS
ncbi:MAG: hypothetical protein QW046_04085 [Candidatus Micrarchaeaceae archaeon]